MQDVFEAEASAETGAPMTPALPGRAEESRVPAPESHDPARSASTEEFNFSRKYEAYGDRVEYEGYDESWKPPGLLDAPDPRPGFVQRWVSVSIAGRENTMNLQKRLGEKWRPRDPATVPDNFAAPTIAHNAPAFAGCIGVEGMVLMERPEVIHRAHVAKVHEATKRQMDVIRGNLHAEQKPGDRSQGFSSFQDHSERRVSKGVQIQPADDDD